MAEANRILIVDDDRVSRDVLSEVLQKAGFRPETAESGEEAIERQKRTPFPVVLSDIRMFEVSGLELLRAIKAHDPATVVVLMTGFGSVDGALEAIREGAFDYLSKPFQMDDLKQVIARATKHHELISRSDRSLPAASSNATPGLLGKTARIVEVYKLIARAALSSSSVLITGEPGTGKALIAQTIHKNSARQDRPFLQVSSEDLERDDFERRLADARDGTIVIEDLAALPPSSQVRLVRAIETAAEEKLGLRWMALSQRTYQELSGSGELRKDLLYPLSVVVVEIPALRERSEDLPEMISASISKYNERNTKAVSHISPEAMRMLKGYSWPGNVRELERVIERAVALSNTSVLDVDDFREALGAVEEKRALPPSHHEVAQSLEEMEKRHIVGVLRQLSFNKSKAAEALGIDRATLYRKAKIYGIDLHGVKKAGAE